MGGQNLRKKKTKIRNKTVHNNDLTKLKCEYYTSRQKPKNKQSEQKDVKNTKELLNGEQCNALHFSKNADLLEETPLFVLVS